MTEQEETINAIQSILDDLPETMSNVDMITLFIAVADAYGISVPDMLVVTGTAMKAYYEHLHGGEVDGTVH